MVTDPSAGGGALGKDPRDRDEMHAAPPFLSWRAIYAIVLAALAAQIGLYAALSAVYR
jgi:hypothetical protein